MALNDINSSSIGFDPEAMKTAMASIKTNLIEQTNNSMAKYMTDLKSGIDNAWRGASADRFKEHMDELAKNMSATLDGYYQNLESEMSAIVNKMAEAEENLVGKAGN